MEAKDVPESITSAPNPRYSPKVYRRTGDLPCALCLVGNISENAREVLQALLCRCAGISWADPAGIQNLEVKVQPPALCYQQEQVVTEGTSPFLTC